jgi:NADPH:quinone reductase
MRAIVIEQYGGPEQLAIKEIPSPEAALGEVVIDVKAFGLNHADIYFRKGIWGEVAKIIGIECVGVVKSNPEGHFRVGQKVAALMGGMGRTINGSYAEVTCISSANVIPIESNLSWPDLAALPVSYATAWTCLNRNLSLQAGQTILIRGATSALGQAAVNIAAHAGAHVIATTRTKDRFITLQDIGAHEPMIDGPDLSKRIRQMHSRGIDAVLDLIGNSTVLDSISAVCPDGRVCIAGFLGGGDPISSFDPLIHMPSGVHLSFFASAFTYGSPDYPLSSIPFQKIADRAAAGIYRAKPAKVFPFEDIKNAHMLMESGQSNGKVVVRLDLVP